MMDATYGSFLDTVARGRRMAVDAVRRIAGGRVFTGSQAVEVRCSLHLQGPAEKERGWGRCVLSAVGALWMCRGRGDGKASHLLQDTHSGTQRMLCQHQAPLMLSTHCMMLVLPPLLLLPPACCAARADMRIGAGRARGRTWRRCSST
jgi:hypothetical protein